MVAALRATWNPAPESCAISVDALGPHAVLSAAVEPESLLAKEIAREVDRRRTFAIISHPDAGKTTLTEKLL